jgi:phospholipase A1
MLPNPTFNWKQLPVVQVWRKSSDNSEVILTEYDATDCSSLFEKALRNNEVSVWDADVITFV